MNVRRSLSTPAPALVGVLTLLAIAVLSACGSSESVDTVQRGSDEPTTTLPAPMDEPTGVDPLDYVITTMREQAQTIDGAWSTTRLIDFLPNVRFPERPAEPPLDAVVLGRITDTATGTAYEVPDQESAEGAPGDGQVEVPFESPAADWRTVHATIEIDEDLDPASPHGDTLTVGFVIGPDVDEELYMHGLRDLGPAVFFADTRNAVFGYDDDVAGVNANGMLIATVGADSALALPFIDGVLSGDLLADSPTIVALRNAARGPVRTIGPSE